MAKEKVIITSAKKGIYTSNIKATPLITDKGKNMTPEELYKSMNQFKSLSKGKGILKISNRISKRYTKMHQDSNEVKKLCE